MRKYFFLVISFFSISIIISNSIFSQSQKTDTLYQFKKISAKEFKSTGLHKWLWGSNYRDVWATPVSVKILNLDTVYGGLTAYKVDTNRESKIVHLKNAEGEEYLLISVVREPGNLLPEHLHNTLIEDRLNDEASITHPYAAATLHSMANAAGIYMPAVSYVYVPAQPGLNAFNNAFGNDLYKIVKENASVKKVLNFNNEEYVETFQLLQILTANSNSSIDKNAFIRERLFDMFINDWNRGEGKWLWNKKEEGDKIIYTPVPKERNTAYSMYDGKLLKLRLGVTGLNFAASFDDNLKNVSGFNFIEKNLDRRLLNEATQNDWQTIALKLQQSLTDQIIENAIAEMPEEAYLLHGKSIIEKLKARRGKLAEWALEYYKFISEEVEIPGTYKNEEFDVEHLNDETIIRAFNVDNGVRNDSPFYSRNFKSSETKQVRLFGLDGNDKYIIKGNSSDPLKIKIIVGANKDSVIDISSEGKKNNNVIVYGKENNVETTPETNVKIIRDTSYRSYNYNWFKYDRNGFVPSIFFTNEDRLYVGLGYRRRRFAWGKVPFASNHFIDLHYSIMENAFSVSYRAIFPKLIAKSDLTFYTNYDNVRWTYFFGLGNETKFSDDEKLKYYTMRTRQWIVQPGLVRNFGRSTVGIFAVLNGIKVIDDTARFLKEDYVPDKSVYEWKNFAGAGVSYSFQQLNDAVIPTKGVYFNATASGARNLKTSSGYYFKYTGTAHFYIPLVSKFSFNIRTGAQTVTGNPEFFQYSSIGGVIFRGVVRDRFWGKTAFYNTNDLRFISPVRTHFFVGKAGVFAFIDNGRVWMPEEKSNTWHVAYGGGLIVAPFNFIYADLSYGRSNKEGTMQVRVSLPIP